MLETDRIKRHRGNCIWCGRRRLLDANEECDECFKQLEQAIDHVMAFMAVVMMFGPVVVLHQLAKVWEDGTNKEQPAQPLE